MVSDNNIPGQANPEVQAETDVKQSLLIPDMNNTDHLTLDLGGLSDISDVFAKPEPLSINPDNILLDKMGDDLLQACAREVKDETECSEPSTPSSPGLLSPSSHSVTSPDSIFSDNCTQLSLVERSEGLNLADELSTVDTNTFWSMVSDDAASLPDSAARKSRKSTRDDAPSSGTSPLQEIPSLVFEAGAAVSSSQFVFTKFGSDVPGIFTFGANSSTSKADTSTSSVISGGRIHGMRPTDDAVKDFEDCAAFHLRSSAEVAPTVSNSPVTQLDKQMQNTVHTILEVSNATTAAASSAKRSKSPNSIVNLHGTGPTKRMKEPSLNLSFPSKAGQYELKLLVQPEEQHRARYMTEGSRGAVKDKSQQGHPVIQLFGYQNPITLHVFVGTDAGKVKPHGFYQACKVCGKNSTSCEEKDVDGTTVIEIALDPKDDMKASIDCVGILKLRNADVEQRIGLARSKKKSTRTRLVFRVNIPKIDGTYQTLQVASNPISCTQPAGMPEMCKKSMTECSANGGEELFIIGKNFTRGTKVKFQQVDPSGTIVWSAEAPIDQEYFHQGHMIVTVPKYGDGKITEPVEVQIVAESSGRRSEPQPFTYKPVVAKEESGVPMAIDVKEEVAMEVSEEVKGKSFVSPEALKLNRMFMEQTGGSDAVLLTPADVARETTVQAQKSPLIPACVEEQLLNAPQVIADLASPVGAQPQYLQPQASSAQQPSPTTQVAPQQPVILQAQPQQQPLQLHKVTMTTPLQQGQIVAMPVNSTSVSIPAGFTLCQFNGKAVLVRNNSVEQKTTTVTDVIGSNEATQGPSALLRLLTSPMDVAGTTTTTNTIAPVSTASAGAAGLQSPSTDVTFPNISVADVDRLLNTSNL